MQPQFYGAAANYNKPKKSGVLNKRVLLIAALAVIGLLLVFIFFGILSAITSGPRNDIARLAARQQTTQKFVDNNMKTVKNTTLKKISSEALLYLGTDIAGLQTVYGNKLPEDIVKNEADITSVKDLEDATQTGKFDEAYLDILATRIISGLELAEKVKAQTGGELTRATVTRTITNLTLIQEQLQKVTF